LSIYDWGNFTSEFREVNRTPSQRRPPPVEVEKEEEQYEVEEILNHKTRNKKKYYLVKWIELLHYSLINTNLGSGPPV
jgi:Chromo (CHRromatin Organisation MOdifier) domain